MYEVLSAHLAYLEIIASDPDSYLRRKIVRQSQSTLEGKYYNTSYEFDDGAIVVHSEFDPDQANQNKLGLYVENMYSLVRLPNPNPENLLMGLMFQDKYPYLPWEIRRGIESIHNGVLN